MKFNSATKEYKLLMGECGHVLCSPCLGRGNIHTSRNSINLDYICTICNSQVCFLPLDVRNLADSIVPIMTPTPQLTDNLKELINVFNVRLLIH
jgi:hypothetical protein